MDVVEQTITDRMLGKIDDATAERRITVGAAVMAKITCEICGNILDAGSTAVVTQIGKPGSACICERCHTKIRPDLQKSVNRRKYALKVTTWGDEYTIKPEET